MSKHYYLDNPDLDERPDGLTPQAAYMAIVGEIAALRAVDPATADSNRVKAIFTQWSRGDCQHTSEAALEKLAAIKRKALDTVSVSIV